ncbi:hypothetical protein EW026_g5265 [Hermanssonia centrifuga]|uniref:FAD-binding domain-containing protein n=1 Tax=Hermanssonia centrifuga TaxID=98765 RepID=A0A4S4KEM2_9APHY|nr:hypothetical protein EW026_g5265 [Hermanssonia centrifuga]
MSSRLPVLIAGAGPAGLVLAILLRKNDIPIRIIERNRIHHGAARGTGITCDRVQPELASASQAAHGKVLRDHLEKLGAHVETGVELIGLQQDDVNHVTARILKRCEDGDVEEIVPCRFLVGADGAKGITRKLLGVPFLGETKEFDRILTANVNVSGVDADANLGWKLALVYHNLASPELLKTYDVERMPVVAEMLNLSNALHALTFNPPTASALDTANTDVGSVMYRSKSLLQLGINYRWSPVVIEDRAGDDANADTHTANPYGQDSDFVRAGDRAPDATELVSIPSSAGTTKDGRTTTLFDIFDVRRHFILVFPDRQNVDTISLDGLATHANSGLANIAVILHAESERMLYGDRVRVLVDSAGHARKGYGIDDRAFTYVVIRPDGVIGAFTLAAEGVSRYFTAIQG